MVLVKEDNMKPFTRTLGAIGATMITAALVVGVALSDDSAAGSTTSTTPTSVSMPTNQMPDMGSMMTGDTNAMADMMDSTDMADMIDSADMADMMDSADMADMMDSADMADMHATMHQMMNGVVDDAVLEECDKAHDTMAGSMSTLPTAPDETQHNEHHGGTKS